MPRFTGPPVFLLDRVSFYLRLTMQIEKKMKEYTSSTIFLFDFLLVVMDTRHPVVRTAMFLFTFSFGDSGMLHIVIYMMIWLCFFSLSIHFHKFIMPNVPWNINH